MARPRKYRSVVNPYTISLAVGVIAAASAAYHYFKRPSSSSSPKGIRSRSSSLSSTQSHSKSRKYRQGKDDIEEEESSSEFESEDEDYDEDEDEEEEEIQRPTLNTQQSKQIKKFSTTLCTFDQKNKSSIIELAIILSPNFLTFLVTAEIPLYSNTKAKRSKKKAQISVLDALLSRFPNIMFLYFPKDYDTTEQDSDDDKEEQQQLVYVDINELYDGQSLETSESADTIPVPELLYRHLRNESETEKESIKGDYNDEESSYVSQHLYKFLPCETGLGAAHIVKHQQTPVTIVPQSVSKSKSITRKEIPETFVKQLWVVDDTNGTNEYEEYAKAVNKLLAL